MSSLSTTNGPFALQDQAGRLVVDLSVTDVPDQAPRLQLPRINREVRLRQVDHQPVRGAQQEPSRIGLGVEIDDDAHAPRRRRPSCSHGFPAPKQPAERSRSRPGRTWQEAPMQPLRPSCLPVGRTTHYSFPASDSCCLGASILVDWIGDTLLTTGIQIRLTKPFALYPCVSRFSRRHKSGLPNTSPNHKSSAGSPQCSDSSPPLLPRSSQAMRVAPIATCDGGKGGPYGFRQGALVARSPCRKQYGRKT